MIAEQKFDLPKKRGLKERLRAIWEITPRLLKMDNPRKIFQGLITAFQPEQELEQIKMDVKWAPRYKQSRFRRALMKGFKEKLLTQKVGIAKIQVELESFIRQNQEATPGELFEVVAKKTPEYKLNGMQLDEFRKAIVKYVENHRTIQKYLEDYKKRFPEDWQREFFKDLFGRYPQARIELVIKPMALFWRCWDVEDFVLGVKDREKREKAKEWLGYNIPEKTLPGLEKLVSMQNAFKKPKVVEAAKDVAHEEWHSEEKIIPVLASERKISKARLKDLSPESPIEKVQETVSNELTIWLAFFKKRAQNEILARLREREKVEDIKNSLVGGYDFFEDYEVEKKLKEGLVNQCGHAYENMVGAVVKSCQRIYKGSLPGIFVTLAKLAEFFSGRRDELIALLALEPLDKWPRLARLINEIESSGADDDKNKRENIEYL
jgi:hypothetical protein